jgi:hypothetical protein
MTRARIYQPAKTAMQSGRANTKKWVLEFEPAEAKKLDPLMGWVSSGDMRGQVKIRFTTKQEAIAFAEKSGYAYQVQEPKARAVHFKTYADNFR